MTSKILIFILTFSLCSSTFNSLAEDEPDNEKSTHVKAGQVVPFTGYLITPTTAEKVRQNKIQLEQLKVRLDFAATKEQSQATYIDTIYKQNQELAKAVVETKDDAFISKVGFFLLGSALAGLISYGVYSAAAGRR